MVGAGGDGRGVLWAAQNVLVLTVEEVPRWCGLALLLGEPITSKYVLGDYGGIVFGLMWVALGYVLWSLRGVSVEQPAPTLGEIDDTVKAQLTRPTSENSDRKPSEKGI